MADEENRSEYGPRSRLLTGRPGTGAGVALLRHVLPKAVHGHCHCHGGGAGRDRKGPVSTGSFARWGVRTDSPEQTRFLPRAEEKERGARSLATEAPVPVPYDLGWVGHSAPQVPGENHNA